MAGGRRTARRLVGLPLSLGDMAPVVLVLLAVAILVGAFFTHGGSTNGSAGARTSGPVTATTDFAARLGSPPTRASSALTITNFSASPSKVAIGQTTYLNVSAVGGLPPYTYWYTGLPYRCASKSVPSLPCTPSESQTFNVSVQVNDSSGAHVINATHVTVWSGWTGPPHIVTFVVVPSTIAVNHLATIYVNATSTSSLGYFFAGLPPGCASFNESVDQCIPSQPGTFHLRVIVQDGFGIPSTSVTDFVVTGSPAPTPTSSGPAPPPPWVAPLAIGLVVAAVLGGGFYLLRRRGPSPPTT